jgi:hypothetical protein
LESEVRELKALLDEKDENIDVLSRIHSHSSQPGPRRKSFSVTPETPEQEKDEVFKVMQSPTLLESKNCDTYFMGSSCGRTLIGRCHFKAYQSSILTRRRYFQEQTAGKRKVSPGHQQQGLLHIR